MMRFIGNSKNNNITDTAGDDVILGMGGNDVIHVGRGQDFIDGGDGNDTLSYAKLSVSVKVDLRTFTAFVAGDAADSFSGIENVVGSKAADVIIGFEGGMLKGLTGDDFLMGRGFLSGGDGDDTLVCTGDWTRGQGGAGDDYFLLTSSNIGHQITISDLGDGRDVIDLEGFGFRGKHAFDDFWKTASQHGDDVLFKVTSNSRLFIENYDLAELHKHRDWFDFG